MLVDALGGHVVGRAHQRVRNVGLGAEETTQSQIAELDYAVGSDENVSGFNICKKLNFQN